MTTFPDFVTGQLNSTSQSCSISRNFAKGCWTNKPCDWCAPAATPASFRSQLPFWPRLQASEAGGGGKACGRASPLYACHGLPSQQRQFATCCHRRRRRSASKSLRENNQNSDRCLDRGSGSSRRAAVPAASPAGTLELLGLAARSDCREPGKSEPARVRGDSERAGGTGIRLASQATRVVARRRSTSASGCLQPPYSAQGAIYSDARPQGCLHPPLSELPGLRAAFAPITGRFFGALIWKLGASNGTP